ncbi:hypothetical protein [Pseudomonas folii]|uniref:Uncharacterized protein n=1 Tax=Pseudomonas folii TaxID=2762593 RepID=A0ABR7AW73_9PSED|nr:hypothetical protein [Pseudomonas folii]MBC3949178.1 hypothetical protein [Pseudomonas folii]
MEPRQKKCDHCGAVNQWESPSLSRDCVSCHKGMDWTLDIKCRNCRKHNKVRPNGVKEAKCLRCHKPLIWTLHPELYIKKRLPLAVRVLLCALSLWLITIVLKALIYQEVEIFYPSKHGHSTWFYFAGRDIIWPVASLLFWATGALALVVNHYDKRFNERTYRNVMIFSLVAGFVLHLLSIPFGMKLA